MMLDRKEENKIFIEKFNPQKFGFFDLKPFVDCYIGFSVKRKLEGRLDDYVTLLSIYIPDRVFSDIEITKKPLFIYATYGKKIEDGIKTRENSKYTDPTDCEFPDEYFYDIETKNLHQNNKIISADELINKVYNKHIKSTKLIRGFWIRAKIRFWRILIKNISKVITKVFYFLLFIISGNRFKYEPIVEIETLNNKVIKSKYEKIKNTEMKEVLKESEKFDFLAYKASRWSIIFYSLLHFIFYIIFFYTNCQPMFLITIFKNNFLTLIYVILSLWTIEAVIPKFLMSLIRLFSTLSFNAKYKSIKL